LTGGGAAHDPVDIAGEDWCEPIAGIKRTGVRLSLDGPRRDA